MSPFLCSVHTHTTCCDGKNTPEEMAAAACAAGVRYYGFSGHSKTPCPDDEGITMPLEPTAYREAVLRLRKEYEGRMEILLGIEQDSCSLQSVPDWAEYWIGSVHNLRDPETGTYYCVDWDEEHLAACTRAMFGGDFLRLTEGYYRDVGLMAERRPTILGHIDLITKLNAGNKFFDEESPRYRAAALEALHHASPDATLLEINTGAISRGYRTVPYPAPFLLREWHDMGGRIILTADTHSASTILFGYEQAAELARACGFSTSVILTRSGQMDAEL